MSRSGYYRKLKMPESEEIALEKAIVHCFKEHRGNYGRIRIRKQLETQGIQVSEAKIARILRKNGLKAKSGRKATKQKPRPKEEVYLEENLLQDKFSVAVPNALWCSDVTELKYHGGKLHVCGVLDVATRRIVGWSIGKTQTQTLVQDAFRMAVGRNPHRPESPIFHSDRGCQYTARRTKELIEKHGFHRSMSRPGTPSDNQPIESFWRTLECEMEDIRGLSYQEASLRIAEYIELYYNSSRLHSGIGYHIPNDCFICPQFLTSFGFAPGGRKKAPLLHKIYAEGAPFIPFKAFAGQSSRQWRNQSGSSLCRPRGPYVPADDACRWCESAPAARLNPCSAPLHAR